MKLPKVVYIGPFDYAVKQKKRLDTPMLLGETKNEITTILIREAQSACSKRDTLLHEVLHAVLFSSGLLTALPLSHDDEERLVVTISPWLHQLLRDNPELIAYLTKTDGAA